MANSNAAVQGLGADSSAPDAMTVPGFIGFLPEQWKLFTKNEGEDYPSELQCRLFGTIGATRFSNKFVPSWVPFKHSMDEGIEGCYCQRDDARRVAHRDGKAFPLSVNEELPVEIYVLKVSIDFRYFHENLEKQDDNSGDKESTDKAENRKYSALARLDGVIAEMLT